MLKTVNTSEFMPLVKALQRIKSRLEREGESRVMIARDNIRKFRRQELAPHNIVTQRKLTGRRVATRDRRRTGEVRTVLARWPRDKMVETIEPTLYFFLGGKADMRLAEYSVQCLPGDIVLVPAGIPKSDETVPEYVEITRDARCDLMMLDPGLLATRGLECGITHSRGNQYIPGSEEERCWLKHILLANIYAGLCEELQSRGNTQSSHYLLLLTVTLLLRGITEGEAHKGWTFVSGQELHIEESLMSRAVEYINNHLEKPLTIDIVARHVAISRAAFTREFHRETGQTFKKYVMNLRLKRAKVLLEKTHTPVEHIGEEVGLSASRLRSLFRQRFECSPDAYRKRAKLKPK